MVDVLISEDFTPFLLQNEPQKYRSSSSLKGTVHPNIKKYIFLLWLAVLFVHLDCFGVRCRAGHRDVCVPFWNNGFVVLKSTKQIQYQHLFPETMTQLLNIIHRSRCEQFHVGITFILQQNLPELLSFY